MRTFNIFGMRRSGLHSIIDWICSSFTHSLLYNDCFSWQNKQSAFKIVEYGDISKPVDCEIFLYEDFEPSVEEADRYDSIVILRDYYNMAASRLVSGRGLNSARYRYQNSRKRSCEEVWLEYAKMDWDGENDFTIIYNKWNFNKRYRNEISRGLELKSPVYKQKLPEHKIGAGSSFGNLDGLNERYKQLTDEQLELITQNKDINYYCKEIFGIEL